MKTTHTYYQVQRQNKAGAWLTIRDQLPSHQRAKRNFNFMKMFQQSRLKKWPNKFRIAKVTETITRDIKKQPLKYKLSK